MRLKHSYNQINPFYFVCLNLFYKKIGIRRKEKQSST